MITKMKEHNQTTIKAQFTQNYCLLAALKITKW